MERFDWLSFTLITAIGGIVAALIAFDPDWRKFLKKIRNIFKKKK